MRALAAACLLLLPLAFTGRARAEDEVQVKMSGGSQVVLERIIAGTDFWESVCAGTCESRIPLEGKYRVTGRGVRPSLPLALVTSDAERGVVHLEPHVRYSSGWIGGIILTVLGPVIGVGASIAIATQTQNQQVPCFTIPCPTPTPATNQSAAVPIGGGLAIGVGITMTVAGILAIIFDDHTIVNQRMSFSPRTMSITF
jgi:hypothetical protein